MYLIQFQHEVFFSLFLASFFLFQHNNMGMVVEYVTIFYGYFFPFFLLFDAKMTFLDTIWS